MVHLEGVLLLRGLVGNNFILSGGRILSFAVGRGPGVQTLFEGDAHDEAAEEYAIGTARQTWGLKSPRDNAQGHQSSQ
jgi:hypothetical protein